MTEVAIRAYETRDEPAVLALLAASLGKFVDDRYRSFFRWKHLQNPFGRSFMWVASVDGELAGFRSFLRWRFVGPDGPAVEAVRAVDTATHPGFRGLGVFRTLTLHAVDEMGAAGVSFVFNTPNDQSRPGYLKMGWRELGRVPVQVRPTRLRSVTRMVRARAPAELWSAPSDAGSRVGEVLDDPAIGDLVLARREPATGLRTDRSEAHLRWRYDGFAPVAARAVALEDGASPSFAIVRFRRRGASVEASVDDVLAPDNRVGSCRGLLRAARQDGADYLLAGSTPPLPRFVTTRRLGPILTWRSLAGDVDPPRFALALGDVELF